MASRMSPPQLTPQYNSSPLPSSVQSPSPYKSKEFEVLVLPKEAKNIILKSDDIKIGEGVSGIRRLFDGETRFDDFELKQAEEFKKYCAKKSISLDPFWTTNQILRMLQANHFKYDKTSDATHDYMDWRKKALPTKLTKEIEIFLNKGVFYISGRDKSFRPIIVFNAARLDVNNDNLLELLIDSLTFLLDTIINVMLLPGRIENWIIIMDLDGMGITDLPLGTLRKFMSYLSNSFRSRLHTLYVVNTPSSIWIPWNMAKGLLEENTIRKINFVKEGIPENLFNLATKNQVEQKYGGTFPNRTIFWPVTLPTLNMADMNLPEDVKRRYFEEEKSMAMGRTNATPNTAMSPVKDLSLRNNFSDAKTMGTADEDMMFPDEIQKNTVHHLPDSSLNTPSRDVFKSCTPMKSLTHKFFPLDPAPQISPVKGVVSPRSLQHKRSNTFSNIPNGKNDEEDYFVRYD